MIDYVCVSATQENRVAEYSDHLHEHVYEPVIMKNGRYMPPEAPGYSVQFTDAAIDQYQWPRGSA
jgi:L-fuconate dehydratase